MVGNFLSNVAILCGTGSSLLVFIDWLLTKKQKEQVRDVTTRAWYWLSVQTPQGYLRYARTRLAFAVSLAFGLLVSLIPGRDLSHALKLDNYNIYIYVTTILFTSVLWYLYGYRIYIWLTAGDKPFKIFRDLCGLQIFIITIIYGPFFFFGFYLGHYRLDNNIISNWLLAWVDVTSIALFPVAVLILPTQIVMLILSLIIFTFLILREITVRIAEQEKGPVLAIAALLTMVGAIAKSMG